jgi:hypothetical protein
MTHWWQLPLIAAILVSAWLATVLAEALERDRGWSRWATGGLGLLWLLGMFYLLDLAAPAWGTGRQVIAAVASYVLLILGEVAHERHTGKPLISLPKK